MNEERIGTLVLVVLASLGGISVFLFGLAFVSLLAYNRETAGGSSITPLSLFVVTIAALLLTALCWRYWRTRYGT